MKRRLFMHCTVGLALLILLLAACSGPAAVPTAMLPSATSTPTSPSPTQTPIPPTPTPKPPTPTPTVLPSVRSIMEDAAAAMKDVGSFHFDMAGRVGLHHVPDTEDVDISMTLTGDVQAQGRLQGDTTVVADGKSQKGSIIIIGDTTYFTDPASGKWTTTDQPAFMFEPGQLTSFDLSEFENMEYIAEETLDGLPVHHVRGEMLLPINLGEPLGETETTFLTDYWVGREDNLVAQTSLAGESELPAEVGGSVTMTMTMRFSNYGVPVVIEAPEVAPVVSIEDQEKALAIFGSAIDAMNQVTSYHFEIVADVDMPGKAVRQTVSGDFRAPNLSGGTFQTQVQADSPEEEVLTIAGSEYRAVADLVFATVDETEYIKDPSTEVWTLNSSPVVYVPQDLMPYESEVFNVVGQETLDDVVVMHLHGEGTLTEESVSEGNTVTYEHEYWVGAEDDLLRKAEWRQVNETLGQEEPAGVLSATMTISGYNVPASIDLPPEVAGPTAAKAGNLRSGPGTAYPVAGSVAVGETLEPIGRNKAGDWVFVRTTGGKEAWIAAFLVKNLQTANLPEKQAPAPPPTPTQSASAPDYYDGVPVMPGATNWGEQMIQLETSKVPGFVYVVAAGATEVKDWYEARLVQEGWRRGLGFLDGSGGYLLLYNRDEKALTVTISPVPERGGTQVVLMFLGSPKS